MSEKPSSDKIRSMIAITNEENSDCVSNAVLGLKKLRSLGLNGKIVFINAENHAYLLPDTFASTDRAVNPPTKVQVGNTPEALVQFKDYTVGELNEMLRDGRADDITGDET